jgi:hypothetical protein
MVLKRFCETKEIPFEVVDPFSFNPRNYSTFIIGGGQLLRRSDDLFYQSFRVPGPHILNTIGIHHPDHLEYLKDYRLVTVRSQAEKVQINQDYPELNIQVCPCLTIQFNKFFGSEIEAKDNSNRVKKDTIGIHLNNTTLRLIPGMIPALQKLHKKYQLLFIPFTHYENDRYLMETLAKWLPGVEVSSAEDPISIFSEIGHVKALISSLMHAATFAYIQNIPVLAFPQDFKIRYFFEERGFPQSLYLSAEEIPAKLVALLQNPPNYSQSFESDLSIVDEHLAKVETIVRNPIDFDYRDISNFVDGRYNELRRTFYCFILNKMLEGNAQTAQIIDLQQQIDNDRQINKALQKDTTESGLKKIKNFVNIRLIGVKRKLSKKENIKYSELIISSGLFDKEWYLSHNPDVEKAKIDPAMHYLIHGGFEGRDPGRNFSSSLYLEEYEDVKKARINPLLHFILRGKSEGRTPRKSRQGNFE